MNFFKHLCLGLGIVGLGIVALSVSPAAAQDLQGKWGLGGFVAYQAPLYSFGERWDGNTDKYGITMSYVSSNRITMELEYHHAEFDNGILERRPFTWGVTGLEYTSADLNPDSEYSMKFNSLLLSAIVHFRRDRDMDEGSFSPYIAVGAGFYDHLALAKNIVWPGQNEGEALAAGAGTDASGLTLPAVVMAPQEDTRTALAVAAGVGLEAFLTPTIAIDTRLRYHFMLTELRPYDAWLMNKVFPLQSFDLTAGFKFYFWD